MTSVPSASQLSLPPIICPENAQGTTAPPIIMPGGRSMAIFGNLLLTKPGGSHWLGSPIFTDWGCRLLHSTTANIHLFQTTCRHCINNIYFTTDPLDKIRLTEMEVHALLSSGSNCYSPLGYIDRPRRCLGLTASPKHNCRILKIPSQ